MKSGQVNLVFNPLNHTDMNFDKSLIGNRTNPHYFIVRGGFNTITEDSTIVDFKPFSSHKEAKKWASKIDCIAVFASHFEYDNILRYKL
jgi:hypothetical protein